MLRVIKVILLAIMILGFCYCDDVSAVVVDFEQLYRNQTRFIEFYDHEGNKYWITYFSGAGNFYVRVMKNNEPFWTNYCAEEGFNKAYFIVWKKYESGNYGVTMKYLHPTQVWKDAGDMKSVQGGSSDIVPVTPPEAEYLKNELRITIPAEDGRKTNKDYISIWYQYCLPSGPDSINITGGKYTRHESAKEWVKDGWYYGEVNVHQYLNMGENLITVTAIADGKTYSDSRIVYRTGFIDEDGDGWDDNTGEGWWPTPDESDWGGVPQPPGEDANIFDYIKYLSDSLIYAMNQMLVMLRSFMGGLAQLGQVLRSFFSFMPTQFSAIILLGLIMAVILRVVGR